MGQRQSVGAPSPSLTGQHAAGRLMRRPMNILLATDAWEPQVNGVVKTLQATTRELQRRGHGVRVIAPHLFRRAGLPGYPEIEVAWPDQRVIRRILAEGRPDHIHIATEGPSAGRCGASPCGSDGSSRPASTPASRSM